MVEKIKKVSNPLTVIAIFAGLAEAAATVALGIVGQSDRSVFIWFVMLFPTLLVLLFFLTLNFNPKVLYAPTDFKDETHFLATFSGNPQSLIEVRQDNLLQVKESLDLSLPTPPASQAAQGDLVVAAANAFFKDLVLLAEPLIHEGKLDALGFGIEADNYFILHFNIARDILIPRKQGEFHVIIHIVERPAGSLRMVAIGHGVAGDDPQTFAEHMCERIAGMVTSNIDLGRWRKGKQSKEEEDSA